MALGVGKAALCPRGEPDGSGFLMCNPRPRLHGASSLAHFPKAALLHP